MLDSKMMQGQFEFSNPNDEVVDETPEEDDS